ncbi:MAG: 50S ribosomal protein L2, partial [Anaerococcus obesiensis]
MPIRKLKPTSNGHRNMSVMTYSEITKKAPEKSLTTDLRKSGGRNTTGRIT